MSQAAAALTLVAVTVYWLWVYYPRAWRLAGEAKRSPRSNDREVEDSHAWLDALTETDVTELEGQGWEPPARVTDRVERLRASRRCQAADLAREARDRRRAIGSGAKEGNIR
jgi:hypothetical protein